MVSSEVYLIANTVVQQFHSLILIFLGTPCTGRQVHLPCTAHCVSTCEDPDPICSRQCVPGCGCPTNLPIWFQGGCIPRVLCPPPTGKFKQTHSL